MAEFGVQATELSASQGAGSAPLAPVERREVNTVPMNLIEGIGNIFAKGLQQNAKDEAAKRENTVLKEYSSKVAKINDALSRGALKPAEAATRIRAIDNEYAAGYPEYIEPLTKQANFFRGKTEIGEAEDTVKREAQQMDRDLADASKMGYPVYSGQSKESKEAVIKSYRAARQMEHTEEQRVKRNAEERAQRGDLRATESHEIAIRNEQDKQQAVVELKGLASANVDAFIKIGNDMIGNTTQSYEEKALTINNNLARMRSAAAAMAGTNPELANSYMRMFDDLAASQLKLIDPKNIAEGKTAELNAIYEGQILKGKILSIVDPEVYKAVVADKLFKGDTLTTLGNSSAVTKWLMGASFTDTLGNVKKVAPPIIGTENEKATLDAFSKSLDRLQAGKVEDVEAASLQAVNVANQLLKDTAKHGPDIPAKDLKDLTRFYASSQFGKLAREGKLDPESVSNAQKVFETRYQPLVKQAILERLNSDVQSGRETVKLIDQVSFNFSGDRIKFGTNTSNASNFELTKQYRTRKDLETAEEGLNQMIHMGAHLEGHTDYKKYWESNKHELLPGIFPVPPNAVKPPPPPPSKPAAKPVQQTASAGGGNWWEK